MSGRSWRAWESGRLRWRACGKLQPYLWQPAGRRSDSGPDLPDARGAPLIGQRGVQVGVVPFRFAGVVGGEAGAAYLIAVTAKAQAFEQPPRRSVLRVAPRHYRRTFPTDTPAKAATSRMLVLTTLVSICEFGRAAVAADQDRRLLRSSSVSWSITAATTGFMPSIVHSPLV